MSSVNMTLPPPSENQVYCYVSALEAGLIYLPDKLFITGADPDNVTEAPSLSFLITHSTINKRFIFDLGIRRDWQNYPPGVIDSIKQFYAVRVNQDVVESLAKGNLLPTDIDTICLSHVHWDHTGDTTPFKKATFLVGSEAAPLIESGYPSNPAAPFAQDLVPLDRTKFLDPSGWSPLGPFPRALDFYEDGSLYIIDAPGHLPGHINVLIRTSSDGGWLYLAGDSAHHWKLIRGEAEIAVGGAGHKRHCAHVNKELAEEHLARIRALRRMPRVRVLLAHDEPWYKENHGGSAFCPGEIPSL